jgi:NAD(P)-dependent dehydrogenase (short-subunit alcohol dehydrogenase family)
MGINFMKNVLITGVSRGIGMEIARKFLDEGWNVLGTSTSSKAKLSHVNLKIYKLDMLEPQTIQEFINQILQSNLKLDILINNAGASFDKNGDFVDVNILRKTLEVNLIGLADLTGSLLPCINRDGHIVNISSGAGSITEFSGAFAPAYQISKTALNMYTRVLAGIVGKRDIIVSSVSPGWVRTDMGGKSAPGDPKEAANDIYCLAISKVETGLFWYQGKKRAW